MEKKLRIFIFVTIAGLAVNVHSSERMVFDWRPNPFRRRLFIEAAVSPPEEGLSYSYAMQREDSSGSWLN